MTIFLYLERTLKTPDEYEHAIRVGEIVDDIDSQLGTVALLHDVVEDGYATVEELREMWGLSGRQCNALNAITRRKNEKYFDYIERVKQNPDAVVIKLADLQHNIKRCASSIDDRWSLIRRYAKAYGILKGEWNNENIQTKHV